MTIELQTGLPGHCKTLYTLDRIEKLRKQSGRPVFYSGIAINKEKLPDWQEIDAEQWFTAPPMSIVIIDECQRLFRPRPNGSQVPKYESELETHRHGGIDLVLLTQNPRLLSVGVRSLVGRHLHAVRKFGMERSTIHEWPELRFDPQKRKDSIRHEYKFNREVFDWYKSAEAHTVQRNIPMKIWVLLACIVAFPCLIGLAVWKLAHINDRDAPAQVEEVKKPAGITSYATGQAPGAQKGSGDQVLDFAAQHTPRVPGLAYTAPIYDNVTQPTQAPYPAAVVANKKECRAYSQQGTRLQMPDALCRDIVAGGFFIAWDQQKGRQGEQTPAPVVAQAVPLQAALMGIGGAAPGSQIATR